MKLTVRALVLVLSLSGAVACVASSRSASQQLQLATLGHQVVYGAMPAAACSPANCNIRGGK